MKSETNLKVCGSITKRESLILLKRDILDRTVVAEADQPYSNYYGKVPDKPMPNSLFLFTERYYTLEEAIRFVQNIDICTKYRVNVATAMIIKDESILPAIRIRNFPDYKRISMLQECFIKQGVQFIRKANPHTNSLITVNKCFFLDEIEDGLYLDLQEQNEGYIVIPQRLTFGKFNELIIKVWNNCKCKLFDAALGGLIINSEVHEMIRVYSGHLDTDLLKCIREEIFRWL